MGVFSGKGGTAAQSQDGVDQRFEFRALTDRSSQIVFGEYFGGVPRFAVTAAFAALKEFRDMIDWGFVMVHRFRPAARRISVCFASLCRAGQ